MKQNIRKIYMGKWMIIVSLFFLLVFVLMPFVINSYVKNFAMNDIISYPFDKSGLDRLKSFNADCILVLGAGLKPDGTPNLMLKDRLDIGIQLYEAGMAPKLLLSGDNGQENYDEVNAMKDYVLAAGVPREDIFLDHAGFSTYESMYRLGAIFHVKRAIVVTQTYHQYRSLYIGSKLGTEVMGAASDQVEYVGQNVRDLREVLARIKDFFKTALKIEPTYLGDAIPINGSSLNSWD